LTPRSTWLYASRRIVPYPVGLGSPFDTDARYVYDQLPNAEPQARLSWAIDHFQVDYILVAPPLQVVAEPYAFELDTFANDVVMPLLEAQSSKYHLVYSAPQNVYVYQVMR
jgi:hypothetical protein